MTTAARKSPARKPEDHKEKLEDFEFTSDDGRSVSVPAFNSVKPGVVRKIRKLSPVDQMFTVLEKLADEDTIAILDDLDADEFNRFQREWYEHSGIDLGESAAS